MVVAVEPEPETTTTSDLPDQVDVKNSNVHSRLGRICGIELDRGSAPVTTPARSEWDSGVRSRHNLGINLVDSGSGPAIFGFGDRRLNHSAMLSAVATTRMIIMRALRLDLRCQDVVSGLGCGHDLERAWSSWL